MSDLSGDAFIERAEQIATKDEFVAFAESLLNNLQRHPTEWENDTLESFLKALAGFAKNSEGYYANIGLAVNSTQPSWRNFADCLLAARVYE